MSVGSVTPEKSQLKGFIFGILAAVSYGLNPLFALPLYQDGLSVNSVLFYRYALGVLCFGIFQLIRRRPFRLRGVKQWGQMIFFGLAFSVSSLFLFMSYKEMDAGISSTILFVYPFMTAVLMLIFFHEKFSWMTFGSITLMLVGVFLLNKQADGTPISTLGLIFVLSSAFSYAIYLAGVNHSALADTPSDVVTFYVLLVGTGLFFSMVGFGQTLQLPPTPVSWLNCLGCAIFPSVISVLCITLSMYHIGSTPTAVLGALEPITALLIGVFYFGEQMTPRILTGVVLIILSVTIYILCRPKARALAEQ